MNNICDVPTLTGLVTTLYFNNNGFYQILQI